VLNLADAAVVAHSLPPLATIATRASPTAALKFDTVKIVCSVVYLLFVYGVVFTFFRGAKI
jgi:hypothetical protein